MYKAPALPKELTLAAMAGVPPRTRWPAATRCKRRVESRYRSPPIAAARNPISSSRRLTRGSLSRIMSPVCERDHQEHGCREDVHKKIGSDRFRTRQITAAFARDRLPSRWPSDLTLTLFACASTCRSSNRHKTGTSTPRCPRSRPTI